MRDFDSEATVKMSLANKVVVTLFFLGTFIIGVLVFSRFYITRDYWLLSEIDCNPATEACFVRVCEEDCDGEEDVTYYKLQRVQAKYVSNCDPHEMKCPEIACGVIPSCVEEYCNETNIPDGESCNNPEEYLLKPVSGDESSPIEESISGEEQGLEEMPSDVNE